MHLFSAWPDNHVCLAPRARQAKAWDACAQRRPFDSCTCPHFKFVSLDRQPLHGLACDVSYDFEILIQVQDREPSEFRGRRDDQVRH